MGLPQLGYSAQNERRALQIAVTGASPNVVSTDLANAGVVLFTGAPGRAQGTPVGVSTTLAAPTAGSGTFCIVVSAAASGTLFKMTRRGTYAVSLYAQGTTNSALAAQIGLTLDCAAATCVIGTSALTPTTQGILDFADYVGAAVAIGVPMRVSAHMYITDTQAGGALPTQVAGTFSGGVGVLRMHATTGANAALTTQFVVASIRANITYLGDLAG